MKKIIIAVVLLILLGLALLVACGDQERASEEARIRAAVIATIEAIPSPTPQPSPTIVILPTTVPLDGLFCEYGFCIGHPAEVHFVDASTIRNPATPSTRAYGILFAFNPNLFIQFVWTAAGGSFDSTTTLRYVLEETDTLHGSQDVILYRDLNVFYQPLGPTAADLLPYGAAATWRCGNRDFAWKAYTPNDGMARALLEEALSRFRCD